MGRKPGAQSPFRLIISVRLITRLSALVSSQPAQVVNGISKMLSDPAFPQPLWLASFYSWDDLTHPSRFSPIVISGKRTANMLPPTSPSKRDILNGPPPSCLLSPESCSLRILLNSGFWAALPNGQGLACGQEHIWLPYLDELVAERPSRESAWDSSPTWRHPCCLVCPWLCVPILITQLGSLAPSVHLSNKYCLSAS